VRVACVYLQAKQQVTRCTCDGDTDDDNNDDDNYNTWVTSEVLHTVCFLFKNEFILQNTFTGLQCNLHCVLSQWYNVWESLVFLSGRLRC
jgi:hypothetical protein